MAELHSNLYFKHKDPKKHELLYKLFDIGCINSKIGRSTDHKDFDEIFCDLCVEINPSRGPSLGKGLLKYLRDNYEDMSNESIWTVAGYGVCHFVHGNMGDEIMGELVTFLGKLDDDIHVQAWGCGDDDPWEFWFKFENGKLSREDACPEYEESFKGLFYNEDGEEDLVDIKPIYDWWHKDMPEEIKEGFCNDMDEDEEDDE